MHRFLLFLFSQQPEQQGPPQRHQEAAEAQVHLPEGGECNREHSSFDKVFSWSRGCGQERPVTLSRGKARNACSHAGRSRLLLCSISFDHKSALPLDDPKCVDGPQVPAQPGAELLGEEDGHRLEVSAHGQALGQESCGGTS